jgi:hypothetical protein
MAQQGQHGEHHSRQNVWKRIPTMVLRTILLVGLLALLVPAEGVYHTNVSY